MSIETEYIVCDHKDGSVDLIVFERYKKDDDLIKAINDNHSENRNRFLLGSACLFIAGLGGYDVFQRISPLIKVENFKIDGDLWWPMAEALASLTLISFSSYILSEIPLRANQIQKVVKAFEKRIVE